MNLPDSKELQELISLCKKKDRKAQERLFKLTYPLAIQVCRRYTPNLEDAQSTVNDGMIKVFGQLDYYSPELSFGGWVRRIMVNASIDQYRKTKRLQDRYAELEDDAPVFAFDEGVLDQISAEEILELVDELPPAYRMVFLLYAVEGYNHREIGDKLGISEGTSKSNYFKAKAKLQRALTLVNQEKKRNHG